MTTTDDVSPITHLIVTADAAETDALMLKAGASPNPGTVYRTIHECVWGHLEPHSVQTYVVTDKAKAAEFVDDAVREVDAAVDRHNAT